MEKKGDALKYLPEICQSCRREIRTRERVVVLGSGTEKKCGEVTFKESVADGVVCMNCVPDEEAV